MPGDPEVHLLLLLLLLPRHDNVGINGNNVIRRLILNSSSVLECSMLPNVTIYDNNVTINGNIVTKW